MLLKVYTISSDFGDSVSGMLIPISIALRITVTYSITQSLTLDDSSNSKDRG